MRACEFCLRVLAQDRDVEFKHKPVTEKQWGEIVSSLELKVRELREANRKEWSVPEAREAHIRYYAELVQELRGFNEAWRRHLSHADVNAFYTSNEALTIFNHVRRFMEKIAQRISERAVTPKYWHVT